MEINERYSLRERKAARTKLDLLRAMLELTNERELSDISIKELCEKATISEGTFFNYFKKKTDLILYFIKIWSHQVHYLANHVAGLSSGLKKIEYIFQATVTGKTIGNNRIMYEIISLQSDTGELAQLNLTDVTELELMMQFPNLKGIENIKLGQFIDLFVNNLLEAIHEGELPTSTDLKIIIPMLGVVFFGVPLIFRNNQEMIFHYYELGLNTIWTAANGEIK